MGGASIWHWVVVGGIVMLLFGRGKISEMMGDVAKGIKAFKKGMSDEDTATATNSAPIAGSATDPIRSIDHRTGEPVTSPQTLADRKVV